MNCGDCGKPVYKKDSFVCKKCNKILCGSHAYSYIDGNNVAITKNSPTYCKQCYLLIDGLS